MITTFSFDGLNGAGWGRAAQRGVIQKKRKEIKNERFSHEAGWESEGLRGDRVSDADYAYIEGPLTLQPSDYMLYPPIQIQGEFQVRNLLQESQATGRPTTAAVRVKAPLDDNDPTRYELVVWPLPDGVYTLDYRYRINPDVLS